jgi:hypothetical protein
MTKSAKATYTSLRKRVAAPGIESALSGAIVTTNFIPVGLGHTNVDTSAVLMNLKPPADVGATCNAVKSVNNAQ